MVVQAGVSDKCADTTVQTDQGNRNDKPTFPVGSKVLCQATFASGTHSAEVVEARLSAEEGWTYYVHYVDCDKRLDEWVTEDKLRPGSLSLSNAEFVLPPARLLSVPSLGAELASVAGDQKMTRRLKRKYDEIHPVQVTVDDLAPAEQHLEKEHQEKTKVKNIQVIELGKYEIDTWYYSPYPEPYASLQKLYICEYTLKYFKRCKSLIRHMAKNEMRHPPGNEIYRSPPPSADHADNSASTDPPISVFEVDGKKNKVYCQSLCLLSKLFLDHKTLYYDVDPFLFYVLCERDQEGYHIVGYFSKEKYSVDGFNLACILTLPPYQRKGYGRFLIAFSYELSMKEAKIGTPERPLSDLGQVSYRSYWTRALLDVLREHKGNLSIRDLSEITAIRTDDVVKTLESLNLIKYWKGDHIISVTPRIIEEHLRSIAIQKTITVNPAYLHWTPYVAPLNGKK